MTESDPIAAQFVERYNADLAELSSPAHVALPTDLARTAMLELHDEDGRFLCFIPSDTTAEMANTTYRVYGHGLNMGARAGEQAAWAKLRALIGAAAIGAVS